MGTRWPLYSVVRFMTDTHRAQGAPLGTEGYIVDVYEDAYEVEVSELGTGETAFLGAVRDEDLALLRTP